VGQARRLITGAGIGCSLTLLAAFIAPPLSLASSSSTNFAGALIERLTPSGFVAMTTPQPDLAAAQAQEAALSDQGFAGWQGAAVAAESATDAWAVGSFNDLHGRVRPAIEHYVGTSWHYVRQPDVPTGSFLTAVTALASNDAWAVGGRYAPEISPYAIRIFIEHWDGALWRVTQGIDTVSGHDGAHLDAVYGTGPDDVWVGGASCSIAAETPCAALFEHWDGQAWSVVPAPAGISRVTRLSADTPADAWAVGDVGTDCFSECPTAVLHWNGTMWKTDPSAVPSGYDIRGVSALTPHDAWAVGNTGTSRNSTLFEHWDGTSWRVVAGPTPGHSNVALRAVSASSSNDVYAVGSYTVPNCCHQGSNTFAEHWDGTAWHIVHT